MASELQSQISKGTVIALGGNLAVDGRSGGGVATVVLRRQISPAASVEIMGSAGLRALLGVQTSRYESFRLLSCYIFFLSYVTQCGYICSFYCL